MKRKLSLLLGLCFSITMLIPVNANARESKGYLKSLMEKQYYSNETPIKVYWDGDKNAPMSIEGILSKEKIQNSNDAINYLKNNLDAFNLKGGGFKLLEETRDDLGYTHYKMQYELDGIIVYGGNLILHTNKEGYVVDINGQIENSIPDIQYIKNYTLSEDEAIFKGLNFLQIDKLQVNSSSVSKVLYNVDKEWYAAYFVNVLGDKVNYIVFVDGSSGSILHYYNNIHFEGAKGTGTSLSGITRDLNINKVGNIYYLEDISRVGKISTYDGNNADPESPTSQFPGTKVSSSTTNFNTERQKAAVDAHYFVSQSYDFFKNNFNREGFDGKGGTLTVSVHVGKNFVNAFYDGQSGLYFGDGDNRLATNFAKSMDIVAHEFTHGVTQNSAKLVYQDQSGALNESFSDVFGCMIENNNWIIGEDAAISNQLKRSLENPTLYNQPDHMKNYYNTTQDNGGVHTNSGIPNKAFYNIATILGKEKATAIYYRALTTQLTSTSKFIDARIGIEKAAEQLYGKHERWVVGKAFYDVGVGTDPGLDPGEDIVKLKAAIINVDKLTNIGDYTLSITVPLKNTARTIKVLENNSVKILEENIDATVNEVKFTKIFKYKPLGTYNYDVILNDGINDIVSNIKVIVSNIIPSQSTIKVDFITTSDWGSGANFNLILTNISSTTINEWDIEFSFDKKISTMWNCKFTAIGSNRYKIINEGWQGPIETGKSITLGGACEGNIGDLKVYDIVVNGSKPIENEDLNGDGKIDVDDLARAAALYNVTNTNPIYNIRVDINKDNIIDIYDLVSISRKIS